MPSDYRKYKVVDGYPFSSQADEKKGIHKVVQLVKPDDGPIEIRVCYYTKRRRNDGSEWWGLSPRPLAFSPEEATNVANGILTLADKYQIFMEMVSRE